MPGYDHEIEPLEMRVTDLRNHQKATQARGSEEAARKAGDEIDSTLDEINYIRTMRSLRAQD
ncbi:hypothetical protein ACH4F6_31570 [Streptomyces sp. NPDC017936]|uniref:hypothetical protein n=1 Tax=Streptomyces sp. NPDC017936 TaxID=3365016 RepID=UPI0037A34992